MADVNSNALVNQGIFRAGSFVFNQEIAPGQTGDLVTIGTAGKITKLTYLTTSTTSDQGGISVIADGEVIVSEELLSEYYPTPPSAAFFVGNIASSNGIIVNPRLTDVVGEFITISKNTGDTLQAILYSYITGSVK